MISFRYHIVSLVAVFFAMAIGVVIGTTVINEQLVRGLESQRNRDRAQLAAERERTAAIEAELSVWDRVATATLVPAMKDKLAGRTVVVIAAAGEEEPSAEGIAESLADAGAGIAGRLAFTPRWALATEQDRLALAGVLGTPRTGRDALLESAVRALGERLRRGAPARERDLLEALAEAEFIRIADRRDGAFPPRGVGFLYVQAGGRDVVPNAGRFALPLVRALAAAAPVAVVEPLGADESLTERVTADERARARVVTVDHVDTEPGMYALVVGFADRFAGEEAAHYGIRRRTSGVVPAA